LLEVRALKVAYGGINAVKGIDLDVRAGEMITLIGANGAGKTTTLRALARLVHPAGGSVRYNGVDILALPSFRLVELGMALVPEGRGIFGQLTVAENLAMGAYRRSDAPAVRADLEHVYSLFPRLGQRRRQTAGTLSGGEQQMLAIGRALMGAPELLLLDEPSLGLAPIVVAAVFDALKRLNSSGLTILLVEQNARRALEIADYAYVMERGRIVDEGESSRLRTDPNIQSHYLGVALSLTPTAGGSAP
jgi:branched-chain amino acid transport system ATP-binding protein